MSIRAFPPFPETAALLERLIEGNSLPSTVLLSGPIGSGKRELAFQCAAKLLNDKTGGALRGENTDLSVFDYQDKVFKVDYARDLKTEAFKSPAVADCRVFVIMHVQNMKQEAQNALLKLLEEPPAQLFIFLLCENENALLQTIRSRCLKIHMTPPAEVDALDELRAAYPSNADEELLQALRYAGGWPSGAKERLEALTSEKGEALREFSDNLIDAALERNELAFWQLVLDLEKPERQEVEAFVEIFRERLSIRIRHAPLDRRLLLLDTLTAQMRELLSKNVNSIHVLQLLTQYFA